MNKIERQLLKNDREMLAVLRILSEERNLDGYTGGLNRRLKETKDLLLGESEQ